MPEIKLFELGPTRSARCRWTLLEAGLEYESIGNDQERRERQGDFASGEGGKCPRDLA